MVLPPGLLRARGLLGGAVVCGRDYRPEVAVPLVGFLGGAWCLPLSIRIVVFLVVVKRVLRDGVAPTVSYSYMLCARV